MSLFTLKEACEMNTNFKHLAEVLKTEMEKQAFRSNDFPNLKTKYEYLTELVNLIHNETFEETNNERKP
ncbi:MAG: hypothetical protein ACRDCE_08815 [Cetobacterium sp.]|uniref:hypothetical protein n=1 Tax=Cetobacterium sp. TaxID=2071632 RepID=UPI003EE816B1